MEQIQRQEDLGGSAPGGAPQTEKGGRRGKKGDGKPNGKGNGHDTDQVVGRKEGQDGQEAVVSIDALKKGMPKAIKLEKDLTDARADASKFYKKWAKECGLNTAQLRNAAKAYANEEAEAASRKAEQLSLIFTECGA